ncbi:MAG: acyl-CoA dehydrogenase N-terminal domain-containing protein, partial [Arenimonas sp.]
MNSYTAPLRDIRFALFDVLDAEALYQKLGIVHAQRDLMDAVLDEAAKFTQNVLAPLNAIGDEHGCRYDKATGAVTTPPGFKEAYAQFVDAGWTALTAPEAMGGQDLPESLGAAVKEMLDAANLAWGNYPLLSHGAIEALKHHGEPWQQEVFLKPIISGQWTGTMCLTEAHAGSDLGMLKTRAEPTADNTYAISGTKIFIT